MFAFVPSRVLAVTDLESNRLKPDVSSPETSSREHPAKPAAKASASPWPWVLGALALIATGAWWWAEQRATADLAVQQAAQTATQRDALAEQVTALETRLEQLQRNQQGVLSRLESSTSTNQVLREELLGMGERAALLEDAVARLTQSRVGSETILRLNEAEFLLLIGGERLRLFGDVAGAVQAYSLAESALASLDDLQLATLRQTLTQELVALRAAPADPRPQLRAELSALAAKLPQLASHEAGQVLVSKGEPSKLMSMLSSVVTVRRVDPATTLLGPAQRQAALAAIALKLELAQAALARPDQVAFGDALKQAQAATAGLLDETDAQVNQWLTELETLRKGTIVPELPVLGATLRELNALRASRAIAVPVRPLALPESLPEPTSEPSDSPNVEPSETVERPAPAKDDP